MVFIRLHIPQGTRDHLPSEVEHYRYIEDGLREIFTLWGYQEIRSPIIEFVEVLSTGIGSDLIDSMFKFQDFDGKLVALRPEMTAPVARIVTTRMLSAPEPVRLFYISNVFRYSRSYIERGREFWQAGVELVGCNTPEADGEILALVVFSLKKLGLKEVRVDIGHASLFKDLVNATGLTERKKESLQNLLEYRDKTRLEEFMDQNDVSSELREAFLELSSCRRLDEVASLVPDSPARGKPENCLRNLSEVNDVVADYGYENFVFFDFSLRRKIEYYTGIVFEVSVPNLGVPLGGGGRYDDFIEKFGKLRIPATGFAFEIERFLQALAAQGIRIPQEEEAKVLVKSDFRKVAIKTVNLLRKAGLVVLLDITKYSKKKAMQYAKLAGIDYLIFMGSSLEKPATIHDLKSDIPEDVLIETFLRRFCG